MTRSPKLLRCSKASWYCFSPEGIEGQFASVDEDGRTTAKDLLGRSFDDDEVSFVLVVGGMDRQLVAIERGELDFTHLRIGTRGRRRHCPPTTP